MKTPAELTDEELRIEIAEFCGWKITKGTMAFPPASIMERHPEIMARDTLPIPDYPNDLNAMWDAEEKLKPHRCKNTETPWEKYFLFGLLRIAELENCSCGHLAAKQRAIAFVKTIRALQGESHE